MPTGAERASVLTAQDVSVAFRSPGGATPVTHGVSFRLERGRTLALVGESGSGKSVTAMAVLGLLPGNADVRGSITFDGQELVGASEAALVPVRAGRIGVVFQEPMTALNPVYTVGSLISQALRAQGMTDRTAIGARVVELLRLVGVPEPEERARAYPHELSGGLRQRAMIALAISGDPEVLIADEPTTALDVTVQAEILALLRRLQRDLGMAVLFITHDMGVVADVADRVCVMKDGVVVEEEEVRTLFASPRSDYTRRLLAAVPRLGTALAAGAASGGTGHGPQLELRGLDITYPGRLGRPGLRAVHDVSLTVSPGQIIGLVGESGSGKSTIGKAISGLVDVSAGSLSIDGQDVGTLRGRAARRARRHVSVVFQDPASSLNPRATIGASISEPLRRHEVVTTRREARDRARALLEQVRLPADWVDRYPHELSGGQRQRVGIARAISIRPHILVADEPTSALDVSVQAEVLDLFRQLQRELSFACLFISHDLAVVEMLADRVVVLRQGSVVEQGPTAEVLGDPQEDYTRALIAAAPVPDPVEQRRRSGRSEDLTA